MTRLTPLLLLSACAMPIDPLDNVIAQASVDFDCGTVQAYQVDSTYMAHGCGLFAIYSPSAERISPIFKTTQGEP